MGLDTVELVLFAEKEFSIALPDDKVAEIRTVREFCDLIEQQIKLDGREVDGAAVLDFVTTTLTSKFKVPRSQITESAEIVKELGLDQ
ncbi:hypothetical protein [Chitinimonas sp. BJYL2]|uniref:hypothetical protein n=1 Tax=Chitinimonas sp. BJYL2 TaxID=2976696 RepID=UPI0022B39837|nr:hypothetical protein [Chitinimonas sp. BJYL2]